WREGSYGLLVNGIGTFSAELSLSLPNGAAWEKSVGVGFSPMPAAVAELRVTGFPPGKTLQIVGEFLARKDGEEQVFQIPGEKAVWRMFLDEPPMEMAEEPVQPSLWALHAQVVGDYADGRLKFRSQAQAQADSGSGLSLVVNLPANVASVSVTGEDIEEWKLLPRGPDGRKVRIDWKTRDTLDRVFLLNWEVPQSPIATTWELAPLRAERPEGVPDDASAGESRILFVVRPVDGLELSLPAAAPAMEARQLPGWLRTEVVDRDGLIVEIVGEAPVNLDSKWLPRLETAQATISTATFETRVVGDGSMLVTAEYSVRHGTPMDWMLELPKIDQILTCEVNRQATSPILRSENQIEFRLPAPQAREDAAPGTTVKLCYSMKSESLDPVSGKIAVELPLTELFIHRLDWALTIPDSFEPTAVEGNVQISTGQSKSGDASNLIHLEKELCRGEKPAVELFYQRRELGVSN
ncbi:MAG: hypothetical protein KDM63_19230, partial [Verrucomicrobiae bacterium]|nr:hypothetical protein [Verrucomicrobiae bacterium]